MEVTPLAEIFGLSMHYTPCDEFVLSIDGRVAGAAANLNRYQYNVSSKSNPRAPCPNLNLSDPPGYFVPLAA
jgi:hypothetical protein